MHFHIQLRLEYVEMGEMTRFHWFFDIRYHESWSLLTLTILPGRMANGVLRSFWQFWIPAPMPIPAPRTIGQGFRLRGRAWCSMVLHDFPINFKPWAEQTLSQSSNQYRSYQVHGTKLTWITQLKRPRPKQLQSPSWLTYQLQRWTIWPDQKEK